MYHRYSYLRTAQFIANLFAKKLYFPLNAGYANIFSRTSGFGKFQAFSKTH